MAKRRRKSKPGHKDHARPEGTQWHGSQARGCSPRLVLAVVVLVGLGILLLDMTLVWILVSEYKRFGHVHWHLQETFISGVLTIGAFVILCFALGRQDNDGQK